MFHFHKWTKWEEYQQCMTFIPRDSCRKEFEYEQKWQKRVCEKCGYTERKQVKGY